MDAVIHNAGAYSTKGRSPTQEGHATVLAVNRLAPYILTALIQRPRRLVYLSSGMHRGGSGALRDIDWIERRAGSRRKWAARERRTISRWAVSRKTWLAVSADPAATVSGGYWHHRLQQAPAKEVSDARFQDQLSAKLTEWTGLSLCRSISASVVMRNGPTSSPTECSITFREQFWDTVDVAPATVVIAWLTDPAGHIGNCKLRGQFTRELRPGSRVVSYWVSLCDWEPTTVSSVPAGPTEPVGVVKLWVADGKARPWLE